MKAVKKDFGRDNILLKGYDFHRKKYSRRKFIQFGVRCLNMDILISYSTYLLMRLYQREFLMSEVWSMTIPSKRPITLFGILFYKDSLIDDYDPLTWNLNVFENDEDIVIKARKFTH